jgi:thioredoxin 1
MNNLYNTSIIILLTALFFSCGKTKEVGLTQDISGKTEVQNTGTDAKVTFIELGSVNCVPCRQMQPIMKSVEEKYKGQVKVVFYDVWKDKKPAQEYKIKLIPTQVFLDEAGKEFFRHEGFFPEEDIDKLLEAKGLTVNN